MFVHSYTHSTQPTKTFQTGSKVCSSVRTGAIAGVFTYATSKQMLSMVGGSLNLRRLKFKAIRDGIPLWRKVFDLLSFVLPRSTRPTPHRTHTAACADARPAPEAARLPAPCAS